MHSIAGRFTDELSRCTHYHFQEELSAVMWYKECFKACLKSPPGYLGNLCVFGVLSWSALSHWERPCKTFPLCGDLLCWERRVLGILICLSQNINWIADINWYWSILEIRYKKISWHGAADFSPLTFCREQNMTHKYLLLVSLFITVLPTVQQAWDL